MDNLIVRATALLVIPTAVILGGGYLMQKWSGREKIDKRLSDQLSGSKMSDDEKAETQKGLGARLTGYNAGAVNTRWGLLNAETLNCEQLGLEYDLIFPFLYGGVLAAALLCAWAALGRPFASVWLSAPVAVTILADWTENSIQLNQLKLFRVTKGVQAGWIQVASLATMTKWLFLFSSSLLLIVLLGLMIGRSFAHRS